MPEFGYQYANSNKKFKKSISVTVKCLYFLISVSTTKTNLLTFLLHLLKQICGCKLIVTYLSKYAFNLKVRLEDFL